MKVMDPGHAYQLDFLDGQPVEAMGIREDVLTFVKRDGVGYPGNVGHYAGTNLQEVLRACVDRVKYLERQIPHADNPIVLMHLREAIWHLEHRAAERHGRKFPSSAHDIETRETCSKCGHIGCEGGCR